MTTKVKTGTRTSGLKNRAMFIVAFMIALLSVLFYFIMSTTNKREIQNISNIYDGLLEKYYNVTYKYVLLSYRSMITRLLNKPGLKNALELGDRESLRRLTGEFLAAPSRNGNYLREINWYLNEKLEIIRSFKKDQYQHSPSSANPLALEVIKNGKKYSNFFVDREGMTFRIIQPVKVGSKRFSGAVEIVSDPDEFLAGVRDMLEVDAVIILLPREQQPSPAQNPATAASPLWRERYGGYYIKASNNKFPWLQALDAPKLQSKRPYLEISIDGRTYLVHNRLKMADYQGKPVAMALAARDITGLTGDMDKSFLRLILTAAAVLIAVFLILYYSFGRLVRNLVGRDLELEKVNKELGAEIEERRLVEGELKTHRNHLEEMIAEGTMELEIKSQEIEANEMKLRTVTSSIRDAILMTDTEGVIMYWNDAALKTFGFEADEIRLKNFYTHIIPAGNYENFIQTFGAGIKGEVIDIDCKRNNGQNFPAEMMVSRVEIQGEINVIVLLRDVTRKREEETQKRIMLRAVEQSNVGIQITDTEGVIQYVNPKFSQITGYERDEVIGRTSAVLKSGFNPDEDYRNLWETISDGKDWQGELYNRKKSGELYWDATLISPIKDTHGSITHFVAIREDVTERKNMEVELLTAKENAEAASRAKGEFLANMSHEIRTPMNAIMGMTELALGTDLKHEQREYLDIVAQASRSLLKLLNDILDFSKVDAGKLILEIKPFDFRTVLAETIKTLAVQAHKKKLELVYFIDSLVPDRLIGDAGRLRQVVFNLIGNAIKFTEEGEIVLKIDILEDGIDNKILLHFVVSDTGIGIQEDQLNYIFEQFSQVDASSTRKYGGTGLGLAISSRLVELMGGVIWAESPATFPHSEPVGPGSTFHFTGLFELSPETTDDRTMKPYRRLKGLSPLIVDDNETNRRFLLELLARYGLKPDAAASGPETLELLKREKDRFDILILDFRMPGMDGVTLLDKIRTDLKLELPAIFLTSGANADELLKFKSYPGSVYLFKPVNPDELLKTMMSVMGLEDEEASETLALKEGEAAQDGTVFKLAPLNILVAEDNSINQRLIRRLLENDGHTVTIAPDGQAAVNAYSNNISQSHKPFDIILMDIQMPEMDGVEATRLIRKQDKNIPIIALTAHAMKGDKGKFLSQGMDDYVSKPIDKTFLFETISKYAGKEESV